MSQDIKGHTWKAYEYRIFPCIMHIFEGENRGVLCTWVVLFTQSAKTIAAGSETQLAVGAGGPRSPLQPLGRSADRPGEALMRKGWAGGAASC